MAQEPASRGERTRAEIVSAAHRLFVEQGYHGTSMRQIAALAGITLSGIYNHFSSKEDIFAAVFLEHHPYLDIFPALNAAQGDTHEALVRSAAALLVQALAERPDFLNLMFIEIVEFDNSHVGRLYEIIYPQLTRFANLLAQNQTQPLTAPVPVQLKAFLGFFVSYYLIDKILGTKLPGEFKQGSFEDFVDIYLHGIMG